MGEVTVEDFLRDVELEVARAKEKFPSSDGSMCALTEEVGELAKAYLDEPWVNVWDEAVQAAAMCARVATEGDPTLNPIRADRGNTDAPNHTPSHYVLLRAPGLSVQVKEATFFVSQLGLAQNWGKNWLPVYNCKSVEAARDLGDEIKRRKEKES